MFAARFARPEVVVWPSASSLLFALDYDLFVVRPPQTPAGSSGSRPASGRDLRAQTKTNSWLTGRPNELACSLRPPRAKNVEEFQQTRTQIATKTTNDRAEAARRVRCQPSAAATTTPTTTTTTATTPASQVATN